MTLSQWAMEDVEALCLEPSFLMADPMGPLLDQVKEEALSPSSEGKAPASPSPYSMYASSLSLYQALSPPPSPAAHPSSFLGTKDGVDSFPWLGASDLLNASIGADNGKDDTLACMDWMLEKTDLNSLIESYSCDGSLSFPESLLASLDSHMDVDIDSFNTTIPSSQESLDLSLPLPSIPSLPLELPLLEVSEAKKTEVAPDQEVIVKSEPLSPAPSSPFSPTFAQEEEDEEKVAKSFTATISDPSENLQVIDPIVLSSQLVVVVTNKDEPPLVSLPESPSKLSSPSSDCDDDSGIESWAGSPPRLPSPPPTPSSTSGSSRTKPYTKPEPATASSPSTKASKVKSVSGAPKVVEKKLKKMEQNKTAATRYRQKKRVEQEQLNDECLELEKRNQELEEKAESISREIKYLKDLMEEVRKRRNKTTSVA